MSSANIEYSNQNVDNRWRAKSWRLIVDGASGGAQNMAVDEALLRAMSEDLGAPILRFYGWQPSCLSIGRFQKTEKLSLENTSWVRRPTGGRAVWHDLEVTYSVVLREEHLPRDARSVVDSYRFISEGFLRGLQALGVRAEIARGVSASASVTSSTRSSQKVQMPEERKEIAPNCFETQTRADFVVDGRKILGAAQCRQNGAILQHGSLLLYIDRAAWREKVGGDLSRIITLRDLGLTISREELQNILARGISQKFDTQMEKSDLTARETQMAKALLHKYHSSLWNETGREETAQKLHGYVV